MSTAQLSAKEWLSNVEAAHFLGVREQTLAAWRMRGKGPRFSRCGRLIRYRRVDLDAYLGSGLVETADCAAQ